ncbi:serine/threonine-protein kinase pelle isoform X2 [Cephus cinctus]|uniref:non-specific serine/threonine protein kinase n=1 Tax=Cephus cinctus TaxID=211228 RepID=A0AAJ7BQR4_CEPCN|nr:serine/threonine-protein kinase pelle isoform X2 [Cephus cinctus]
MASGSKRTTMKYIYNLPYREYYMLCRYLNADDTWEDVAGNWMNMDVLTIMDLRRQKNPAEYVLNLWGHENHTIVELFVIFHKMKFYEPMKLLQPYVSPKYHYLLHDVEKCLQKSTYKKPEPDRYSKDMKIGEQNCNWKQPAVSDLIKLLSETSTKKDHCMKNKVMLQVPVIEVPQPQSDSNNLNVVSPKATPLHDLSIVNQITNTSKKNNNVLFTKNEITLPQATYEELVVATDMWSIQNVLSKGSFSTVYKGQWKNTAVAIKRMAPRNPSSDQYLRTEIQQSFTEIKILNSRPHENILPLYAYSLDGETPCLIYQLMQNGSLDDALRLRGNSEPLSWLQRHEIAVGTARGLQYLHTIGDRPLIHGDIKSSNILLNRNLEPRLGDFGLAREGPEKADMLVSKILGTKPYLPDDYLTDRRLSTKIDTYSFGIVLYELATGLLAYDNSRPQHKFLKEFVKNFNKDDQAQIMDKKAGTEMKSIFINFILLGNWCTNKLPKDRPEMEPVFRKLNNL